MRTPCCSPNESTDAPPPELNSPYPYNYPRFRADFHDLRDFAGPRAGEAFPPHRFRTVDGRTGTLNELFPGQWVALESGSCTCPMYARNVEAMARLAERHPECSFAVLYVREAHPGERIPAHQSQDEKLVHADGLRHHHREWRSILVDDLEGSAHRRLGLMPNFVYLVSPEGCVHFRRDWSVPQDLEKALADRDRIHPGDHTEPFLRASFPRPIDLWKGGWSAVWDFLTDIPRLVANHARAHRK
ncbi:MAG: deiodinase-like protein [Verrucomicrobiota bacterium]